MITANTSTATPTIEQDKNISLNISKNSDEYFPYFTISIPIMYIIIVLSCLCGLVGNVKVIWILGFCIKRNPLTTYILNLAVADFSTLFSVFIYFVYGAIFYVRGGYTRELYILDSLADFFVFFSYSASLYLLTAISLERALSVLFPIWYRCRRPRRSSAVVSVLLWSLSGLLSGMFLLVHLEISDYDWTVTIISIINFLTCTPVMIASTLTVLIIACRNSWRRHPPKLYRAILITLLVFIIFGIPMCVSFILFSCTEAFPLEGFEASFLLASINSSVNPLIYYLVGRDRKHQSRESLNVVFQRLFKDDPDPRESN